jgi:prevent-host-death family protein
VKIVNMHAAKSQLSDLIKRASAGEEIVIARDGLPVARLVPIDRAASGRRFGAFEGRLTVPRSFFEPLPAEELGRWNEE